METEIRQTTGGASLLLGAQPVNAALPETASRRLALGQWGLVILPFGLLWSILIRQLSIEWRVNPQYSHGFIVPILCLSLLLSRWQRASLNSFCSIVDSKAARAITTGVLCLLAFIWLPARLLQEADPEWRFNSWTLALDAIGLTLATVWMQSGRKGVAQFAFPVLFFLVAVPWPTILEQPLIQLLTRVCAALTVEVAGFLGIPALQHGNVIEVATGTVGIDEACSGIRSFQSTLMIAVFLGELYGLTLWRRIAFPLLGFSLALFFNICRTSFLTWVAATKGVGAIAKYHDPAGVTIMIACLIALWLLALLLRGRSPGATPSSINLHSITPPSRGLRRLALGLLIWILAAETSVELWYRVHEWRLPRSASWRIDWPRENPTYAEHEIGQKATTLLRYDEANCASWRESDGTTWYAIYLRWLPGRIAAHLANLHTPDVCLTASGHAVEALPDIAYLPIHGLKLPFREYVMNESGDAAYVFYCLWEDRAQSQFFKTELLTYDYRFTGALAGQRNSGQRSLEIMIRGPANIKEAEASLAQHLSRLIRVGKASDARS